VSTGRRADIGTRQPNGKHIIFKRVEEPGIQKIMATKKKSTAKKIARVKGSAEPHVILGIHVADRAHHATGVQAVLTEHGANIKTRLGLHDVHDGSCSPNGLILIEYIGDDTGCKAMVDRLTAIEGVEVKRMVFEHV
jgi:hypothetical protein